MRSYHRMLALALALALMVSCLPMGALRAQAAELETTAAEEAPALTASTETVPEETEEAAAPAEETEAAAEPELPAEEAAVPKPSAEETEPKEEPQTAAEPPAEETQAPAEIAEQTVSASEEVKNDTIISGTCGENLTWVLDNSGTLTISGTGDMNQYYHEELPWVDYIDVIRTVVIEAGVASIGNDAFYNCRNLTRITIPESVTKIGAYAFACCDGLTNISIPSSVVSIGYWAFYNCSNLTTVAIPDGVTEIKGYTFCDCRALTSVTLPDSVTCIGQEAFSGCTSLRKIILPKNLEHIENFAFAICSALNTIVFRGDAPLFEKTVFQLIKADAYYPDGNPTWTEDVMQNYLGTITWKPYTDTIPATPNKPYKIANVVSGVHVYWNAVDGAEKYGLWRSETGIDGTYKWIANPTVPHFTDTNVVSGKTYYYKVTSLNSITGETSEKSAAIGITFVSTPDITSRSNVAAGVKLGWEKITGATGYAIYRKSYDGDDAWVRVATISGNSTFTWTDTSVKNNNGEIYKYTIRALAGSSMNTLSGCRNAGRTMARLSSQVLTSAAKASTTSIKCTWTTSSRVTGYEVRFMVGSTVYKTFTIGNYKTGVKTFTGLTSGQTYTIQVRTYKKVDGVGSFYSDWSTAKTVTLK